MNHALPPPDTIPPVAVVALAAVAVAAVAALMSGCATRLHVDSAVVTLERHNRGETTESCDGTIYATTSRGEVRTRHVRMAVPAGESRRRYLGTGDHFIDGRYSLSCVPHTPTGFLQVTP